ncbi:acetolactate decarboxylase [Herbiconiux sp. P18]|uniref:acetolactate decarboxylase n=1 Tax=Herbiconiux liangxiaofengii TaxID=3342795 RepID=UPI0035BA8B04
MRRSHASKKVQQFSVVDALVAGLFDGEFPVSEVVHAGDFGLGCGDHMDGELVLLDGVCRLFHGDGSVTVLEPDETLAFAQVVPFAPELSEPLEAVAGLAELVAEVRARVASENLFHAVRFRGRFDSITLREAVRQTKPYRPLAEAVHTQRETTATDARGTIVGFVTPPFFQGIGVAGPHLHFVDDEGRVGGHVLGLEGATGELSLETYFGVSILLPHSEEYLSADLGAGLDAAGVDRAIRHAESDSQH